MADATKSYAKFDLERALAGDKVLVLDRGGNQHSTVDEIAQFKSGTIVISCTYGKLLSFDANGEAFKYYLAMAPRTRSVMVWVNGYPYPFEGEPVVVCSVHSTEAEADKYAAPNRLGKAQPVTFTWDEV